ncbi:methyltransferase domain-containing protein [Hazenella sp. IB182353]|uniref:methyltransferase n=1 Tax=Polycladospora coralii TaxID=2771432 RepID=UPI0017467C9D|nr:methyltransferase [Polycladospora coralii]MBS7531342.1 methyltransferase domain-containing protein [Polycladospora coralii]
MLRKKTGVQRLNQYAESYDDYAAIFCKMAHRLLLATERQDIKPLRILDIGCGTGYTTQLLIDRYPEADVVGIDLSPGMLRVAEEKILSSAPLTFICADVERFDLSVLGQFDLIVSSGVLHWLLDIQVAVNKWIKLLTSGGWLMVNTFGSETLHELHKTYLSMEQQMKIKPTRHGCTFPTSKAWHALFKKANLIQTEVHECWYRAEYTDCQDLLQTIKCCGESFSENGTGLFTQCRLLQAVQRKYNEAYTSNSGVYTTYHMMQMIGCKP